MPQQCTECGAPLRDRARFCLRCGHVIPSDALQDGAQGAAQESAASPASRLSFDDAPGFDAVPAPGAPHDVGAAPGFDAAPPSAPPAAQTAPAGLQYGAPAPGAGYASGATREPGADHFQPPAPAQEAQQSRNEPSELEEQAAQAAPGVNYRVVLTFADGSGVMLASDAVLGRKPEAAAAAEGLVAVPLVDPVKSSSRVHLRLFLRPQGVHVVDADSGNGTSVEHDGVAYECVPGQAFWIEPGDRLWLGDVPVEVSLG